MMILMAVIYVLYFIYDSTIQCKINDKKANEYSEDQKRRLGF